MQIKIKTFYNNFGFDIPLMCECFHRSFMSLDNLLLICRLPVIKKEIVLFQLTQSHFFVNPYMFPFHTKLFYQNVKKKKNTDSN